VEGYFAVDKDSSGSEVVRVDGSQSHTHGPGLVLTQFIWSEGSTILGNGEITDLTLSTGLHKVDLRVVDSGGNEDTFYTNITVLPGNFPEVTSVFPTSGQLAGGDLVTINGTGFTNITGVKFGVNLIPASSVTVVSTTQIRVLSPSVSFGVSVPVSVVTAVGESLANPAASFRYIGTSEILFSISTLFTFTNPSTVAFGPDGKLYAGNTKGAIAKFTMNEDYSAVVKMDVSATVAPNRDVLGIAFDPSDPNPSLPAVYFSSSKLFHGESRNSFGDAVNGKISRASGANLDIVQDIVTGLPVSELDHSVNGIEFGKCSKRPCSGSVDSALILTD
jgi:hypothetical protein